MLRGDGGGGEEGKLSDNEAGITKEAMWMISLLGGREVFDSVRSIVRSECIDTHLSCGFVRRYQSALFTLNFMTVVNE